MPIERVLRRRGWVAEFIEEDEVQYWYDGYTEFAGHSVDAVPSVHIRHAGLDVFATPAVHDFTQGTEPLCGLYITEGLTDAQAAMLEANRLPESGAGDLRWLDPISLQPVYPDGSPMPAEEWDMHLNLSYDLQCCRQRNADGPEPTFWLQTLQPWGGADDGAAPGEGDR